MIDLGNFKIVKYDTATGVLTTRRAGGRFEDFEMDAPGSGICHASKHFGDHEHDSSAIVDADDVLDAAWRFHAGLY